MTFISILYQSPVKLGNSYNCLATLCVSRWQKGQKTKAEWLLNRTGRCKGANTGSGGQGEHGKDISKSYESCKTSNLQTNNVTSVLKYYRGPGKTRNAAFSNRKDLQELWMHKYQDHVLWRQPIHDRTQESADHTLKTLTLREARICLSRR